MIYNRTANRLFLIYLAKGLLKLYNLSKKRLMEEHEIF